jgi:DHA1 family tetracycline resistance protein-like MFS transporter
MADETKKERPLLPIFLTVVIDLLGFGIVLPLLPLYGREFGASHAVIAAIFISYSGMQFISAPMWGRLSDRIGRRPVILIGLVGSILSYTCFAFAAMQETLTLLFISRLTAGVFGGTISTAYAYIADVTPPEERGRGMALIGMAFGIGFTIGPAIGGIGHSLHPTAPGIIAALFSTIAFVFAWRRLVEPTRHVPAPRRNWLDLGAFRSAFSVAGVRAILLLGFVAVTCFALMESTLGLLGREEFDFDYWQVGLLFTYLGFFSALAQGMIVRRYMKRVGEYRFVVIGALTLTIGLVLLAVVRDTALLIAIAPLSVVGFALITPSLNSLLSRRSKAEVQGGVMGVNQSLQSLARIVGPGIGLPLLGVAVPLPFWVGAGLMGFCLLLGLQLSRHRVDDVS